MDQTRNSIGKKEEEETKVDRKEVLGREEGKKMRKQNVWAGGGKKGISLRQRLSRNPDRPEMKPAGERRLMRDDRMSCSAETL